MTIIERNKSGQSQIQEAYIDKCIGRPTTQEELEQIIDRLNQKRQANVQKTSNNSK